MGWSKWYRACFVAYTPRKDATCVLLLLLFGLIVGGVFGVSQPAKADPHGVFYTAIGQKQLFFNVLAALDQVDYVEYEYERQERVDKREEVEAEPKFEDEEFELLDTTSINEKDGKASDTDPGVADLLARGITIEGNDLYNDQLIRQYGAEFSRRNAMSELLRTLCEYGLGISQCDPDLVDTSKLSETELETLVREICVNPAYSDSLSPAYQPMCGPPINISLIPADGSFEDMIGEALGLASIKAYIKKPLEWSAMPFFEGVIGALSSGTALDEAIRAGRMGKGEKIPRAFSASIARWRETVTAMSDSNNRVQHENLLSLLLGSVQSDHVDTELEHTYPYLDLVFGEEGISFAYEEEYEDPPSPGDPRVPLEYRIEASMMAAARAKSMVQEIAMVAAERISAQQEVTESEGLLAEVDLESHPVLNDPYDPAAGFLSEFGELTYLIKNPVAVRAADVYSLPINLGLLNTSQQVSALKGIDKPGDFQLVAREEPDDRSPGEVNGVRSGVVSGYKSSVSRERVLGDIDLFGTLGGAQGVFMFDYDEKRHPTSPNARIVVGHLEQGAVHALRAITGGLFRKSAEGGDAADKGQCGGITGC